MEVYIKQEVPEEYELVLPAADFENPEHFKTEGEKIIFLFK